MHWKSFAVSVFSVLCYGAGPYPPFSNQEARHDTHNCFWIASNVFLEEPVSYLVQIERSRYYTTILQNVAEAVRPSMLLV